MSAIEKIYKSYKDIHHLECIQELLDWDQQVMMPVGGASQRGEQAAALAKQVHRALTDPALGDLLGEASSRTDLTAVMQADMQALRRRRERAMRIPADLMARHALLAAVAQGTWEKALAEKSFAAFRDVLAEIIATTREVGLALDSEAPYDALIEEYEPGMNSAGIADLFSSLGDEILVIMEDHRALRTSLPFDFGGAQFPARTQKRLAKAILKEMGLDFDGLRLDTSTHPCTSGTGRDVRITTKYDLKNPVTGLLSAIHEAGHALYEQGLPGDRLVTPTGTFCSFGIHESQSLFWENIIGRSRPFLDRLLSRLSGVFPEAFHSVNADDFFWMVNRVRPSPVRTEADELTYNIHIVIRFELERALMGGDLKVDDLPEAWNRSYARHLGIQPRNDAEGVLQDIHWAAGLFGYFPSYALGHIYAAQFYAALRREMPGIEQRIAAGDLGIISEWLKDRVHSHARRLLPGDLVQAVTGAPPSTEHLLRYWRGRYVKGV